MEVGAAEADGLGPHEHLARPRRTRLGYGGHLHQAGPAGHGCAHARHERDRITTVVVRCEGGEVREPVFTETMQISIVVRDMDASLRTYVEDYGIGPWEIYEFNPGTMTEMLGQGGKPTEFRFKIAVTMVGSVQWELVQPLEDQRHLRRLPARRTARACITSPSAAARTPRRSPRCEANGRAAAAGRRLQRRALRVHDDERRPRRADGDLRLAGGPHPGAGRRVPAGSLRGVRHLEGV